MVGQEAFPKVDDGRSVPQSPQPNKPIVLIGGTNGAGKTRLARHLLSTQGLDHMLGTGFIREVVRSTTSRDLDGILFEYSFAGPDPFQTLLRQAERLRPAILGCINRAYREGTSLVIEGTHLIPDLYKDVREVSTFVILAAPADVSVHDSWLFGDSHAFRTFDAIERKATRTIDGILLRRAEQCGVPVLRYPDDVEKFKLFT
jgi:2-phosphoglycerate kinase